MYAHVGGLAKRVNVFDFRPLTLRIVCGCVQARAMELRARF